MNIMHRSNVLLYNIECVLEEDKFLEYAFGTNCSEMLVTFDKSIINIIAYKKILHSLESVKLQISGNKELQDDYLGRIEILKLKLEDKLNLELLGDENQPQNIKNLYSHLKPNKNIYEYLESNSTKFAEHSLELPPTSKNNLKPENIDNRLDIKVINERFKDELVELAEEMKCSAFRFQELLRSEKKVSFSP
ncbi:hypothetical protein [Cryptosporidium parvum Iowa II]|uniref:Uncharacterized protein n=1 Tax=Cryptosporidium parvum (strain Iowa II) TaxID=353152 RepID=Q5CTL5_CRYPI|nr:hypothetical protein [Cryptosporidium parvum Iowa II]EAK88748.1 hypothetical protein cgd2_2520 [Cryptosporidium parvum Iowa II]WKS76548.1 hypothetical protein CPCDC_2g2520 [Cryptosporidium sp. 43IA8]